MWTPKVMQIRGGLVVTKGERCGRDELGGLEWHMHTSIM